MLLPNQSTMLVPVITPTRQRHAEPAAYDPFATRHLPADSALPMLDAALDNHAMSGYLRPLLPLLAQARNVTISNSHLLDYKPGKRALVRYELTTPRRYAKTVVLGKMYGQLDQLMRTDQVMDVLWHEVYGSDRRCGVPQPLGLIPELSTLLYLPVEGQFLDKVLPGRAGGRAMQLTARWLGRLHRHPLQLSKRFDLVSELKNLAAWAALVGQTYPEMAALVHELVSYVQRQAQGLSLETETPIHKDFHYRHVLYRGCIKNQNFDTLNVFDFDEMRLGDPNFDLAHFCANLHLLAYRHTGTPRHYDELGRQFLFAYGRQVGQTWPALARSNRERFRFFYVYSCIKIARQLCLGFGPRPAPVGDERRQQVRMILEQGKYHE